METVLNRYNPWWYQEIPDQKRIARLSLELKLNQQLDNEQIIFITGLRRIGKTSLMKMMVNP